jgi:hypothetical protein
LITQDSDSKYFHVLNPPPFFLLLTHFYSFSLSGYAVYIFAFITYFITYTCIFDY